VAFRFCLLQHHPPAVPSVFLAVDLPGRSVSQHTGWFVTCDQYFCCMEHYRLFSYPVPRNSKETCVSLFSRSLTQPSNERLAFFRVDWASKISLFVQPLTLPLRNPEGLNDLVLCSIKNISPSPLLQSNLLSLTWYFKDTRRPPSVQLFSLICINLVSTRY